MSIDRAGHTRPPEAPGPAGSGSSSEVDEYLFRHVLGRFGTGVTVVTTRAAGRIYGMTANAFMSGSLRPPLVVVSVGRHTTLHNHIVTSGLMGISILGVDQEHHGRHFSGQACQRIEPEFEIKDDVPVVKNALATITTKISASHSCGDHTLFVGRVRFLGYRDGSPLLYFKGRYNELAGLAPAADAAYEQWDLDWQRAW